MAQLTVIIPAYNEESRLPATLASVYGFLSKRGKPFDILVVDDGSLDGTVGCVEAFKAEHPEVDYVSYKPNQGKGHAVRIGMLAGKGELLIIDDADGSSPIEEIARLEASIECGADLAIGSRAKPDSSRTVQALTHRKLIGNTFNLIVQSLLLPGIYDTQCGFKMFKREAARDIFSVAKIDGFGFDVETLYIARMRGYSISEVAINWHNVEGSKVNVITDSARMFLDVLRIMLSSWTGRYKRARNGAKIT